MTTRIEVEAELRRKDPVYKMTGGSQRQGGGWDGRPNSAYRADERGSTDEEPTFTPPSTTFRQSTDYVPPD